MPTRVSWSVPFDLIVARPDSRMRSTASDALLLRPLSLGPTRSLVVRVDELQNILLTYYHTLTDAPSRSLWALLFLPAFRSVHLGFVLIKCLYALLFKLVSFHSGPTSASIDSSGSDDCVSSAAGL